MSLKDREKAKAWQRIYNKTHKKEHRVYYRTYHLLCKYGITYEQKIQMLKDQTGQCIICGKQLEIENACIDHAHETGKVRGILCHSCNKGLGHFLDNSSILIRAAKYIDSSKESMLTPKK